MALSLANSPRAWWQWACTRQLHAQPTRARTASKRHRWTGDQDERLVQLVAERGRAWTEIAGVLGITGGALKVRSRWLALQPKRRDAWSREEDERLAQVIREYMRSGNKPGAYGSWVAVAKRLQTNRTPAQCHMRWTNTLLPHQGKQVGYTRFRQVRAWSWAETEIARLQSAVDAIVLVSDAPKAAAATARKEPWLLLGDNASEHRVWQFWVYVSSRVQTRTAHQCQQKWLSMTQVEPGSRCTTDEARRLAQLVKVHGRKWTFLASEHFRGRRPVELYRLDAQWRGIERRHGVDLLGFDPFSRIRGYDGTSALRPTGASGDYDPSGPLVHITKPGTTSALAPYILALMRVGSRQKRRRKNLASRMPGVSGRTVVPSEIVDRLFAALSRHKNDWVSISRSVGIPASKCRMYADVLAERLPSIRAIIRDAELEQLARDHTTSPPPPPSTGAT